MDIKTKKIINVTLVILLIILILLIMWIFFNGKSFSKFKTTVKSNGVAEIAKPIFLTEGNSDIKIDGIEDTIYNFTVKNNDNENISDVNIKYYIEIINNSQADLDFELIDKNNNVVNLNNNKSGIFELIKDSKQNDNYTLKIRYTNNSSIVNDIEGNVQIKVEAIQAEVI